MNFRKLGIKAVAGGTAVVTALCLGESGIEGFFKIVDFVFIKTGMEPLHPYMSNPNAKWFKGYKIYDPITETTKKVSKKEYYRILSEIPDTKVLVKQFGKYVVFTVVAGVVAKVVYDKLTEPAHETVDPRIFYDFGDDDDDDNDDDDDDYEDDDEDDEEGEGEGIFDEEDEEPKKKPQKGPKQRKTPRTPKSFKKR